MTTLLSPLRRALLVGSDRIATTCCGREHSYEEVWERCCRLIGALYSLGLGPSDRVAVISPNCHRFLELYQAVPGAGMNLVPLNPRHAAAELRYALEDSGARVLFSGIGDNGIRNSVERVFDLDEDYEALLARAEPAAPPLDLPEETVAGLFYTGGTTGASKGVMLTHRNLLSNAMHFGMYWPFTSETAWLTTAPIFHAAGSVAVLSTVWAAGRHVVLPSFDPAQALDLVEDERVTATLMVPTMLAALSDEQLAQPRDVSSLRYLAHGGSPCASETIRRAHQAFPSAQLLHLYGATETAPIATAMPHEEHLLDTPQIRSCGQPAIGVEVEVHNSTGATVPRGEVGELAVRGPNVMLGYWNKPVETDAALVDGWYRTGDLGYQDEHGFLYLVDRAKDMIVSGGENVYSTEVEDALYRHPAVLEAAVFGVPDAQWGEAVHAVVVLRSDSDSEELIEHCRTLIARYKVPKRIEFRTQPLPKSGAGKVLKRELREPYWESEEARVAGA
jgi:long-chain acyl-CoA synthetase